MQINKSALFRTLSLCEVQALVCVGLVAIAGPVLGAPVIQQVTGALDHKGTITITGTGFGTKANAAPLVFDDATGSDLSDKWSGAWPNRLPGYNTNYYDLMRGIAPPHSHDTRYIAGAHAANTGADSGFDVIVYKTISRPAFPFYIYASWYQRADDKWAFGQDNNFKTFDYSAGTEPYTAWKNWYTCYGPPHPGNVTDVPQWTYEPGLPLKVPDVHGHNAWWSTGVNPMAGKWAKIEISIKVTDQMNGFVNVSENGRSVMQYAGPTDNYEGTDRTIGIGGYARMQGYTSNWRYYDDVYVDLTLARVVLANNPVLSRATIIENQIPTSWADGSITATVNLGQFGQGQAAYLFVVDATGTPSATGSALTAGGSASMPNPPQAVTVH
jgi:hypothetical protein